MVSANIALRQLLNGDDNQDWDASLFHFGGKKTLIDGATAELPAVLMARRINGATEYRLPTPEEEAKYAEAMDW